MIGTSIAAVFLLVIAAINIVILVNVYRAFRRVRTGAAVANEEFSLMMALESRQGVSRYCRSRCTRLRRTRSA